MTKLKKYTASNRLRFVIKYLPDIKADARVLQQYWYITGTMEEYWNEYGEWRDVLLEEA